MEGLDEEIEEEEEKVVEETDSQGRPTGR